MRSYVSGLDTGGQAEANGLRAGDEILAVNGQTFRGRTHADAVAFFRANEDLLVTTRNSGKLPVRKVTKSRFKWHALAAGTGDAAPVEDGDMDGSFTRGGGTAPLSAPAGLHSLHSRSVLQSEAARVLTSGEQHALMYAVDAYTQQDPAGGGVDGLAREVLRLLDTPRKRALLQAVRSVVAPPHLGRFEGTVRQAELVTGARPRLDSSGLAALSDSAAADDGPVDADR